MCFGPIHGRRGAANPSRRIEPWAWREVRIREESTGGDEERRRGVVGWKQQQSVRMGEAAPIARDAVERQMGGCGTMDKAVVT